MHHIGLFCVFKLNTYLTAFLIRRVNRLTAMVS